MKMKIIIVICAMFLASCRVVVHYSFKVEDNGGTARCYKPTKPADLNDCLEAVRERLEKEVCKLNELKLINRTQQEDNYIFSCEVVQSKWSINPKE